MNSIVDLSNWTTFYRAIVQSNLVLSKIPTIPDSQFSTYPKEHYLGEAYFLRSFLFFYVSRVWGDAPLQLEAVSQKPLARAPMDSVVNQAIRDCRKAIPMLSWKNTDNEATVRAVRATRGAAYTLLSEMYMWKKEYGKALEASKAVMDSLAFSGYDLMPLQTAEDNDVIFNGRTREGIFEFDLSDEFGEVPLNTSQGGGAIANIALCYPPYVPEYLQSALSIELDTLNSLFPAENPDRRRTLWFDPENTYNGNVTPIFIKYKNRSSVQGTTKYPCYEDNVIVFRLGGFLLLRAEALANTGNTAEAIDLLDQVRERAGATLYDAKEGDVLSVICQERRKELIGEGHVWFDMVRNGRLMLYRSTIYNESSLQDGAWTWPVDPQSFITNPLLVQMTYWL